MRLGFSLGINDPVETIVQALAAFTWESHEPLGPNEATWDDYLTTTWNSLLP